MFGDVKSDESTAAAAKAAAIVMQHEGPILYIHPPIANQFSYRFISPFFLYENIF